MKNYLFLFALLFAFGTPAIASVLTPGVYESVADSALKFQIVSDERDPSKLYVGMTGYSGTETYTCDLNGNCIWTSPYSGRGSIAFKTISHSSFLMSQVGWEQNMLFTLKPSCDSKK